MKPTDLRNATWQEVQQHVTDDMLRVHRAWRKHGPGTTEAVANLSGISLLTFRPRTTDLYKLGMVECTGRAGSSGIYEYRTEEQAEGAQAWKQDRRSHKQTARATEGAPAMAAPVGSPAPVFKSRAAMVAWAAGIMGREARIKRRHAVPAQQQMELLSA